MFPSVLLARVFLLGAALGSALGSALGDVMSYQEKSASHWKCSEAAKLVRCTCHGPGLTAVPRDMPAMHILTVQSAAIENLTADSFAPYRGNLTDVHLEDLKLLRTMEPGVFSSLPELRSIYIQGAPQLTLIEPGVFENLPPGFKYLRIHYTGLRRIPDMSGLGLEENGHVEQIDLESNKIELIDSNEVLVGAASLRLDYNSITSVNADAFNGSRIATLSLRGNWALQHLSPLAFRAVSNLIQLDLSETSITELPVKGLEELEILRIQDTKTLTSVPSVHSFQHLTEAWLTYAFHCCAFAFPAIHDPKRHEEHQKFVARLKQWCMVHDGAAHPEDIAGLADSEMWGPAAEVNSGQRAPRSAATSNEGTWGTWQDEDLADGGELASTRVPPRSWFVEELGEFGEFHEEGYPSDQAATQLPPPPRRKAGHNSHAGTFHEEVQLPSGTIHAVCGNLSQKRPQLSCYPVPDALNPCEDIMGYSWLRGLVWLVVLATVAGNVAVLAVLLANVSTLTVPRFLMCHLALADLCMGLYLLLLAAMDLQSQGEYFNYAFAWQVERGCAVAGFLTIFSSQLSIYTLCVITLERWFAITCAIDLNKRIHLGTAAQVMVAGWLYALLMAALPLLGVSSYASTSICLPMDSGAPAGLAYVIVLLLMAALAFVVVLVCYLQIYLSLGPDTRRWRPGCPAGPGSALASSRRAELSVANKMALLVLTDFTCWAPIAFFSLTALAGHPLISVTNSKILLVFFYPINACANPFLYAILTKQYRKDLYTLLSRCGLCSRVAKRHKMQNFSSPTTNNSNQPLPMTVRDPGAAGFCYDGPETMSTLLTPPSSRTNRIMSADLHIAEPCLLAREEAFV